MWILFLGIFTVCLVVLHIPIILSSSSAVSPLQPFLNICVLYSISLVYKALLVTIKLRLHGSVTEKITWYVLVLNSPEVLSFDKEVLNNKIDLWLVW